jgi:threonine dehydratase
MPADAPSVKVEAVKALGAKVIVAGTTSRDRKIVAEALAARTGAVIIPPFDDPHIIAGQGTATLELFDDVIAATGGEPPDAMVVPVGGGGVIAGACLVAAAHGTQVYSAEPKGCDAMAASLEAGERVSVEPGPTLADGLKPVMVGALNFAIAQAAAVKPLRVDDDELGRALVTLLLHGRVLVEPSGAAGLAAAIRGLPGSPRRIGIMLTGGNLGRDVLGDMLRRYSPHAVCG